MGNKIKRKFSWHIYLGALVITLLIFGAGVFVGTEINKLVLGDIDYKLGDLNKQMQSMELFLLAEDNPLFCEIYSEKMSEIDKNTYEIGNRLEYIESVGSYNYQLKSEYFELEIRDYLLSTKAKEQCGLNMSFIMYFYNNKNCTSCLEQGSEITLVREELQNRNQTIRVYTFDGGINESAVVRALIKEYNVTNYPTIVINDVVFNKTMSAEEMLVKIAEGDN